MENTTCQDKEGNPYLNFQRTPSLRRKRRKRYGGLDGNKLLEPNNEEDFKENGLVPETHQGRNPSQTKSTEIQEHSGPILTSKGSLNFPAQRTPMITVTSKRVLPTGSLVVTLLDQEMVSSVNVPQPMPRNAFQMQSQRPVNLVSPESTSQGLPTLISNATVKLPLPQTEQERQATSSHPWHNLSRAADSQHGLSKKRAAADVLFDSFASDSRLNINTFFEAVWSSGLHRSDPRIKDCYFHLRKLQDADGTVDQNTFQRCVTGFVSLILKALQGRFVIPDFSTFTEETQKLFMKCKQLFSIKEMDSADNAKWAVSICTVDGQRLSLGDMTEPCILGDVSWPLVYGIAVDQLGSEYVHRYVGVEEASKYESLFTLTKQGIPHSPLVETGAIVTTSLIQLAGGLCAEGEEKYESILNVVRRLCNKEQANLNCTSYKSMRRDSINLHALSFFLQEKKCFPEGVDINGSLDLMLQCASTEITCESGAALAASLANSGLCALSGDQVLSPTATRNMLSMMQVAGMKDYSRIFNFKTSVPASSNRSGVILTVVPGVLGLMCWSPRLDSFQNSRKAVHFCEEFVSTFQLHSFDIRTPFRQVLSYRQWKAESEGYQIMNMLLAAYKGDVLSLRRYFLSGVDVNAVDYDGRSALHVAAAEGHGALIRFLVENTGACSSLRDRWGNTALQEAMRHSHGPAVQLLRKYEEEHVTF